MLKKIHVLIVVILGSLLSSCIITGPVVTFSCSGIAVSASITSNVDNTGAGQERTELMVTDGVGTLLYYGVSTTALGTTQAVNTTLSYLTAPRANPLKLQVYSQAGGALPATTVWYQTSGRCAGLPDVFSEPLAVRGFTDGRINYRDLAASFVIYRVGDGYHFYQVEGVDRPTLALVVTGESIEAAGDFPEQNTLIAEGPYGLAFYRLSDGLFQAQAVRTNGKVYTVIWHEDGDYTSLEQTS